MTDILGPLEQLSADGLLRRLRTLESPPGAGVRIDGREVTLHCSNDYLGLADHPHVRAGAIAAIQRWGAGSGSSRLIAGGTELHAELECRLAAFKGTETSLLFGSGYLANTGVLSALAGRGGVVLSDELNHASLIDGCRLARAETIVYPHADLDGLAAGLRRADGRPALIATDAVFSMDGDLAPLAEVVELARRHGARVMVDEAHATGLVGPGGRGLVAELGLEDEIDVTIGTLGKALGSYGAFACCSEEMKSFLVNRARTVIYSTALPPATLGAVLAAIDLVEQDPAIVERLHQRARILRTALTAHGFAIEPGSMPIVPLVVGNPETAVGLSQAALAGGVSARAVRPPTVPDGTSRLRLVATATHTPEELRDAAQVLATAAQMEALAGGAR